MNSFTSPESGALGDRIKDSARPLVAWGAAGLIALGAASCGENDSRPANSGSTPAMEGSSSPDRLSTAYVQRLASITGLTHAVLRTLEIDSKQSGIGGAPISLLSAPNTEPIIEPQELKTIIKGLDNFLERDVYSAEEDEGKGMLYLGEKKPKIMYYKVKKRLREVYVITGLETDRYTGDYSDDREDLAVIYAPKTEEKTPIGDSKSLSEDVYSFTLDYLNNAADSIVSPEATKRILKIFAERLEPREYAELTKTETMQAQLSNAFLRSSISYAMAAIVAGANYSTYGNNLENLTMGPDRINNRVLAMVSEGDYKKMGGIVPELPATHTS